MDSLGQGPQARRTVVELLLSDLSDCTACTRNRNCELQTLAEELAYASAGSR